MSRLVPPHGSPELKPLLFNQEQRKDEVRRAEGLKKVPLTSRETGDLIMMGIGAFTPLDGFMGKDDWKACCARFALPRRKDLFWPIPITLSATEELAKSISIGEEVALWDTETQELMGTMKVTEKYSIDKEHECKEVFKTADPAHPGVQKVMNQGPVNLAGPIKVLSESFFPEEFKGIYQTPAEARKLFEERKWQRVAALQLRNPMHNSHAYLAWVAIEGCDGVYIHQLLGNRFGLGQGLAVSILLNQLPGEEHGDVGGDAGHRNDCNRNDQDDLSLKSKATERHSVMRADSSTAPPGMETARKRV